jgi:hypothetical protein
MSRARMQRNKAKAVARLQLVTALAETGRIPLVAGHETPIFAALAAVLPVTPYDEAAAAFVDWPGYPPTPAPAPLAVAASVDPYRLDAVLVELGADVPHRVGVVRALATAAQVAAEPMPPMPAPARLFIAPDVPEIRELRVVPPAEYPHTAPSRGLVEGRRAA